jgi:hemoglobin-like flavoprotein
MDQQKLNKLCEKVSDLTDGNCHTESLIEIAKAFGFPEEKNNLEIILLKHIRAGHLTPDLSSERYSIYNILLASIKEVWGEEIHDKIYKCL